MVAKNKNMEGGIFGIIPDYSGKSIEDLFLKLKERNSILNKLRVEQRLEAFLKKMAEELHNNSEHFDKFYHMFIHICEKYPSEIRKIQEKEQITLNLRNKKNMYKYEPFYYVLYFFLGKFKNNNNRRKKIIDIHNTNNNNRRMNHLLEKMNGENTSNTKKFKTFFMTNKRNEFLDIVEKKLKKFNVYKYNQIEDIEKKLEKLKKLLEKLKKFEGKIQNSYSLQIRFAKICESLFEVFSNKILELLLKNDYLLNEIQRYTRLGHNHFAEREKIDYLKSLQNLPKIFELFESLINLLKDKIEDKNKLNEICSNLFSKFLEHIEYKKFYQKNTTSNQQANQQLKNKISQKLKEYTPQKF